MATTRDGSNHHVGRLSEPSGRFEAHKKGATMPPVPTRSLGLLTLMLLPLASPAQPPAWQAVTTEDGVWVQEGDRKVLFYQRRPKSKDGKYTRANYVHP